MDPEYFFWVEKLDGKDAKGNSMYKSVRRQDVVFSLYDIVLTTPTDDSKYPYAKIMELQDGPEGKQMVIRWFYNLKDAKAVGYAGPKIPKIEMFLAIGNTGNNGVEDANPLDAIIRKAVVLNTSQDPRNPQPSREDVAKADGVFQYALNLKNTVDYEPLEEALREIPVEALFNNPQWVSGGHGGAGGVKEAENEDARVIEKGGSSSKLRQETVAGGKKYKRLVKEQSEKLTGVQDREGEHGESRKSGHLGKGAEVVGGVAEPREGAYIKGKGKASTGGGKERNGGKTGGAVAEMESEKVLGTKGIVGRPRKKHDVVAPFDDQQPSPKRQKIPSPEGVPKKKKDVHSKGVKSATVAPRGAKMVQVGATKNQFSIPKPRRDSGGSLEILDPAAGDRSSLAKSVRAVADGLFKSPSIKSMNKSLQVPVKGSKQRRVDEVPLLPRGSSIGKKPSPLSNAEGIARPTTTKSVDQIQGPQDANVPLRKSVSIPRVASVDAKGASASLARSASVNKKVSAPGLQRAPSQKGVGAAGASAAKGSPNTHLMRVQEPTGVARLMVPPIVADTWTSEEVAVLEILATTERYLGSVPTVAAKALRRYKEHKALEADQNGLVRGHSAKGKGAPLLKAHQKEVEAGSPPVTNGLAQSSANTLEPEKVESKRVASSKKVNNIWGSPPPPDANITRRVVANIFPKVEKGERAASISEGREDRKDVKGTVAALDLGPFVKRTDGSQGAVKSQMDGESAGVVLSAKGGQAPSILKYTWEETLQFGEYHESMVLLENLELDARSDELEAAMKELFVGVRDVRVCRQEHLVIMRTATAYCVFGTNEQAVAAVDDITDNIIVLRENGRPVVASLASLPKYREFPGHVEIRKYSLNERYQKDEVAVSTAHAAQCNTIEYPMALEWRRLQVCQEEELRTLLKAHAESEERFWACKV